MPLNQIKRSPVVNANSDHVHQQVRSTQQPNVAISQYIAINRNAEGETLAFFFVFQFKGITVPFADRRQPHFAWLLLDAITEPKPNENRNSAGKQESVTPAKG
ncbi:Uncharacterised protein [Vibrio cholerae]|uniref:Uncharacterized protein n=1 Tax=Vibrio cholerae TaxID=666 RepID=A0A655YA19_VIBCL|nr:Uncharacterised protein [Vibrio cholerae]